MTVTSSGIGARAITIIFGESENFFFTGGLSHDGTTWYTSVNRMSASGLI